MYENFTNLLKILQQSATTISCSSLIILGNIINAAGATSYSYSTFVAGRIIFGLGQSVLETAQRKVYYQLFPKKYLALVYALDLCFVRIINVLSKVTGVPLYNAGGFSIPYWVTVIFSGCSLCKLLVKIIFCISPVTHIYSCKHHLLFSR